MVDMRIIWMAQLDLCKAIADDIVKHNASKEICQYADGFAMIESPYGTRGGYYGNDFIRINFGEAYCYVDLDRNNKPDGVVWWNNDEMGIDDQNDDEYSSSIGSLQMMSIEEAYENCEYPDCYDEYEGRETEYVLEYIPYSK
jgi:hypothetical protein